MAAMRYDNAKTPLLVAALAKQGLTDTEIAEGIGVSVRTLYRWKAQHPDLLASLKSGKEVADKQVEASLFKRACGYTAREVKQNASGGKAITVKEVGPDTTACIFWLKNRRPDLWRDVQQRQMSSQVDLEVVTREGVDASPDAAEQQVFFAALQEAGVFDVLTGEGDDDSDS